MHVFEAVPARSVLDILQLPAIDGDVDIPRHSRRVPFARGNLKEDGEAAHDSVSNPGFLKRTVNAPHFLKQLIYVKIVGGDRDHSRSILAQSSAATFAV